MSNAKLEFAKHHKTQVVSNAGILIFVVELQVSLIITLSMGSMEKDCTISETVYY